MKYLLLFIVIFSIPFCVSAQNNYKDVVHLNNGEIRKGIIVEKIPSVSLKIRTSDGNIFVYKMDDIAKITKELVYENTERINVQRQFNGKSESRFTQIELGFDFGTIEPYSIGGVQTLTNMSRIKMNIIHSYKFNRDISLGIGSGLRFYLSSENLLLPLFTDFRIKFPKFKLLDNKIIPYAGVSAGASFFFSGSSLAGVLFNPIVGLCYDLSSKVKFNIGIGYDLQGWPNWYVYPYDQRIQIHSFAINTGVSF